MRRKTMARIGEAIAVDLFLAMLNPKYRGPKFNWQKFPDMADRHASVMCAMCVPKEPTEKERSVAGKAAGDWARAALKRSGLDEAT